MLSITGACSIKAGFPTDDFIAKFSLAKCPCYVLQSRPEPGRGAGRGAFLPLDTVCGEVGHFVCPRAGGQESLVSVGTQNPSNAGYVLGPVYVAIPQTVANISFLQRRSSHPSCSLGTAKSMFLFFYFIMVFMKSRDFEIHTEIITLEYLRITVVDNTLCREQVHHSNSVLHIFRTNTDQGNTDLHCPVCVLRKAGTALSQCDV